VYFLRGLFVKRWEEEFSDLRIQTGTNNLGEEETILDSEFSPPRILGTRRISGSRFWDPQKIWAATFSGGIRVSEFPPPGFGNLENPRIHHPTPTTNPTPQESPS